MTNKFYWLLQFLILILKDNSFLRNGVTDLSLENKFIHIPENLKIEFHNLFLNLSTAVNDPDALRMNLCTITIEQVINDLNKILLKIMLPLIIINKVNLSEMNIGK